MCGGSWQAIKAHPGAGGAQVSYRQTARGEQQAVVGVLPGSVHHTLMFPGWQGELWVQPNNEPTQACAYTERRRNVDGELCVVLGAGSCCVPLPP